MLSGEKKTRSSLLSAELISGSSAFVMGAEPQLHNPPEQGSVSKPSSQLHLSGCTKPWMDKWTSPTALGCGEQRQQRYRPHWSSCQSRVWVQAEACG